MEGLVLYFFLLPIGTFYIFPIELGSPLLCAFDKISLLILIYI